MAIGENGKPSDSTVQIPGTGPRPMAADLGRHVRGSGAMPGTGAEAGEPSAQHPGNTARTAGIK
jgi:hypothetical protein